MRNLFARSRDHGSQVGRLRARRRFSRPVTAVVMVAGTVGALSGVGVASVSAVQAGTSWWRRATEISLPSNAAGHPDAGLGTVACWTASSCEAGGSYTASSGDEYAMVDSRSARGWATAIRLRLPADAQPNPGAVTDSVACAGAGSCVAAGSYSFANGDAPQTEAFLADETRGVWSRATAPELPANAAAGPFSEFTAVACTGRGSCVAAGSYQATGGFELMVATQSRGRWARAREVALPAGARVAPAWAYFLGLACPAAGRCVAVGSYTDSAGRDRPLVAGESNGRWGRAAGVRLPAGAAIGPASLRGLACGKAGYCVAVGSYVAGAGYEAMAVTESAGAWRRPVQVRLAPPGVSAQAGLDTVACDRAGACVAVGGYFTPTYSVAASVTRSDGPWGAPAYVSLPSNARLGSRELAVLAGVSCASTCVAVGAYANRSGHFHPMGATGSAP